MTPFEWFSKRYGEPTPAQREAWPRIARGANVLIASPTGTGKTFAAFLGVLDQLAALDRNGELKSAIYCVYVSPLRALGYDLEKNLAEPLREIYGGKPPIRVELRTGDTTSGQRQRQFARPPHILLTTPESLCVLLSQEKWLAHLAAVRWIIVDEIHALAENKRGAHLALSVERLERAKGGVALQRIGLSATIAPLGEVARFLCGTHGPCEIVDVSTAKKVELRVHMPRTSEEALSAFGQHGCEALLPPWQSAGQLLRLVGDACETALQRRHERNHLAELASSSRELHAALAERDARLEQARLQLQRQHEDLLRLETQAVVSHIARGLAHELNNPLAAILGYAQRLRKSLAADAESVRRLDVIISQVARCQALGDQLRSLATPLLEDAVPCRPDSLLQEALERRREAGHPVPTLRIHQAPWMLAAPQAMVRVFEQLLDNAILAGAHTCELSGWADDGRIHLQLANDGDTPDAEAVRNATRPFFTSWAGSGHHGLGLAIALSLMRDQAGSLALASREPLPGATCLLTLPSCPAPVPGPPLAEVTGGGRVLVVDDEPLVAELLLDALRDCGLLGQVVGTVEAALAAVRVGGLRALIVDVRLPDGSGVDLARRALELRPELAHHLLLVTGGGQAREDLGLPDGVDWPVLGKPFRMEQIARLVRTIA